MNPELYPPGQSAFAAAVQWLEGTLLGSVATAVAVIAVACVGLLLLSGRIDVRRGVQVIFGCFILFGASSIAAGIIEIAHGDAAAASDSAPAPPPPVYVPPAAATKPVKAVPYNPYAGAPLPPDP
jgi:type IV secretory pathway VirB2 component (pilin)